MFDKIVIRFTERVVPQVSHTGESSFAMRYPCVNRVCPILSLVNTAFFFLFKFEFFHSIISKRNYRNTSTLCL